MLVLDSIGTAVRLDPDSTAVLVAPMTLGGQPDAAAWAEHDAHRTDTLHAAQVTAAAALLRTTAHDVCPMCRAYLDERFHGACGVMSLAPSRTP